MPPYPSSSLDIPVPIHAQPRRDIGHRLPLSNSQLIYGLDESLLTP